MRVQDLSMTNGNTLHLLKLCTAVEADPEVLGSLHVAKVDLNSRLCLIDCLHFYVIQIARQPFCYCRRCPVRCFLDCKTIIRETLVLRTCEAIKLHPAVKVRCGLNLMRLGLSFPSFITILSFYIMTYQLN